MKTSALAATLCVGLLATSARAAPPATVTGPNGAQATVAGGGLTINLQAYTSGTTPAPIYAFTYSGRNVLDIDADAGGNLIASINSGVATNGSAVPSTSLLIAGSDGTDARNIKTDASGDILTGAPAVTPLAGTAHVIVTGGTAVTIITGPVKGCYIQNPYTATDEGIGTAETAYVNAVTTATTSALNGSSTPLPPGALFYCSPGQTTNVSANAATSSHNLVVVVW